MKKNGHNLYLLKARCSAAVLFLLIALLAPSMGGNRYVIAQTPEPGFIVTPTSGLTTGEDGLSDQFSVALTAATNPGETLTISLESSAPGEGVPHPQSLLFTESDWDQPQIVTVTGVDDRIDDGNSIYQINLLPVTSEDPTSLYAGLDPGDVSLVNLNDDTAGITISPTGGLVTSESGQAESFSLVLNSEPVADVTINLASSNPLEGTPNTSELVFTNSSWKTSQSVTVTGQDDSQFDGTQAYAIQMIATSSDPAYQLVLPEITVENLDNEQIIVTTMPDLYSTKQGLQLTQPTLGVLANDSTNHGTLSAELEDGVSQGIVALNTDGSFVYMPTPDFSGSDAFTYRAFSGPVVSDPTSVTLEVAKEVTVTANPDSYSLNMGETLSQPAPGVLDNDNTTGNNLIANLVSGVSHGTLVFDNNGAFTYTPAPGFYGTDSFIYRARVGSVFSQPVTVTLNVNLVITVSAMPDSYSTNEDQPISQPAPGVLANDTTNNPPLSAQLVSNVTHGTLTFNSDGSFLYNPNPGFSGIDSFTYSAKSGAVTSQPVKVSLAVDIVNLPPVAVADSYLTNATSTFPFIVPVPGLLANDTDPEQLPLSASLISQPASGSVVLNANGSFTFTPSAGFNGTVSFTYQVTDSGGKTSSAKVDITVDIIAPPPITWIKPGENGSTNQTPGGPMLLEISVDPSITDLSRVVFYRWDATINQRLEIGSSLSGPYSMTLDTNTLNLGWNQIDSAAFDRAGNRSQLQHLWVLFVEAPKEDLSHSFFLAIVRR